MRKSITRIIAAAAATLALLTSCTVKEDRVPCPCYLNVSFADRASIVKPVGLLGWDEGSGERFRALVDVAEHDPYWVKAVRKGLLRLAAWTGAGTAVVTGHQVVIPEGAQCDSLYAYFTDVDCTGEMAYAEVTLRKQFATVRVDILKSASQMRDYTFSVRGGSRGFDLLTFDPVPGPFRFDPEPATGERVISFRVPRQADNSLALAIWYRGQYLGEFPLGTYIARTGYSWTAEELQDIYIVIDLVLGQVTVTVEDWEEGVTFPFIEQ